MIYSTINPYAEMVTGKVELYNGSTLVQACTCEDVLQDFTVERIEENGKFFGFGVCQKTNINLIDMERTIEVSTENSFKNYFGVDGEYISPYPIFYVTEVNRDENSSSISITAYDILYKANKYTYAELALNEDESVYNIAGAIANVIGATGIVIEGVGAEETCFNLIGGNFDGSENLRSLLNAIAEVTQTIYFINNQEQLVFKRLSVDGAPVVTITGDNYYILDTKTNRRLSVITHASELGDNVSAELGISGSTQYVRNNPFWELRDDIHTLLENALAVVGGLSINQFTMNWSGNFLLEIGDRIVIILEDDREVYSYVLNDVVRFLGYVDEDTQWSYEDNEGETASNPASLGEVLKQTTARVDKVKQEIALVISSTENNTNDVTQLKLATDNISSSVERVEKATQESINNTNDNLATLTKRVETTITAEELTIAVKNEVSNGVDKVTTATGFTFNEAGLTVSKDGSEMETKIDEDGMSVYRGGEEVLTADNTGVKAENLHATTYLIIGTTSRLEDWDGRTGCFWIGG